MIRDGQELHYRDWMADDAMRAATAGGIDDYFKTLTQGAESQVEEGDSVIGYRFVYHAANDDRLHSPFFRMNGQQADLELALVNTQTFNRDMFEKDRKELSQDLHAAHLKEGVHIADGEGRGGFYYFPDRDMAEDYMKAAIAKYAGLEQNELKTRYLTTATPINPILNDTFAKVYAKEKLPEMDIPEQYDLKPGDSRTGWMREPAPKHVVRWRDYRSGNSLGTESYATVTQQKLKYGSYELYRVRGIAKKNEAGDGGFIMDEMMYDPEPLVSIPIDTIYPQFHDLTYSSP